MVKIRFLGIPYLSWNFLYLILPLLLFLSWYSFKEKSQFLRAFGDSQTLENFASRKKVRIIKLILLLFFILLIFVALNRPQIKGIVTKRIYQGADVVFVVDVSLSMRARDALPDQNISRLNLVKDKLSKLSFKLGDEGVALVIFAGKSFSWIPFLSRDKSAFRFFIKRLSTNLISKKGTDIGQALLIALKIIKKSSKEGGEKLIFLLTDGELQNEDPEAFTKAIKKLRSENIRLEILGVGSKTGARIPIVEKGRTKYLKDKNNRFVITSLDERKLDFLSKITEGNYQLLREVESQSSLIEAHKTLVKMKKKKDWVSIYQWFLIAGLVVLALWYCL